MKQRIDFHLLAIFAGGLFFNYLFWKENLGLNLLIYAIYVSILSYLNIEIRKSKKLYLVTLTHLLAAFLVILNQSALTIITYYISLFIFVGIAHAQILRTTFTALIVGLLQIICAPFKLIKRIINMRIGNFSLKPILKPIKYIIIPILTLIFFSFIYSIANPIFDAYLEKFFITIIDIIGTIFTFFFGDLSFARFMHVILGILFTAGIILGFKENWIEKSEHKLNEKLLREKRTVTNPSFISELKSIFSSNIFSKKMALKSENIIGILSFGALNVLLLFLNFIDISTVWLGNSSTANNYATELHEGTNALIFSIVMAMMVILYFFSGNLNFFSKNKTIKTLAYIWIIQNAFLVFSVFLRDYNYIITLGLTYKRIGVIIFLLLCSIGLTTVYIKVARTKTLFYLYKTNSFIWYILLLTFSFINWDVFIVNYNINNRKSVTIDLDHLLDFSDKTLPSLHKNRLLLRQYLKKSKYNPVDIDTVVLEAKIANQNTLTDSINIKLLKQKKQIEAFDNDLADRILKFNSDYDNTSWLSWNYRNWQTREYFRKLAD